MQPIKINCPHCNHAMEYWTLENHIYCPKCTGKITVEPRTEKLDIDMTPEELEQKALEEQQTLEEGIETPTE